MASNYTWGQIRFLLQKFAGAGISLDTIDHSMRARYELILSTMEWEGIVQDGILQTQAAYSAGSITATQGSTLVTGVGTAWTGAMSGWQLFTGPGPVYTVTITSPNTLILDRPFEALGAGVYSIAKAIYELPGNCRTLTQVFSPADGSELDAIDQDVFGELEGSFFPIGGNCCPTNYVPWTDGTNSQTGEIVQRILLYPPPTQAQGYPIKYDAVELSFDGTDTTDGPLAFVSAAALIAGCKADLEMEKDKPNPLKASKFEADFGKWLTGMIRVETSKHPHQRMRVDASYTQHRLARFLRSGGNVILRNSLFLASDGGLPSGAGTSKTDTFTATGAALFTLSQVPVSTPVVLVNNTLAAAGTYVQAGKVLNFLAGHIPAAGASVMVIYTY